MNEEKITIEVTIDGKILSIDGYVKRPSEIFYSEPGTNIIVILRNESMLYGELIDHDEDDNSFVIKPFGANRALCYPASIIAMFFELIEE